MVGSNFLSSHIIMALDDRLVLSFLAGKLLSSRIFTRAACSRNIEQQKTLSCLICCHALGKTQLFRLFCTVSLSSSPRALSSSSSADQMTALEDRLSVSSSPILHLIKLKLIIVCFQTSKQITHFNSFARGLSASS